MKQHIFVLICLFYSIKKFCYADESSCHFLEKPVDNYYTPEQYRLIERRNSLRLEDLQRKFQNDMLISHNTLRKRHCSPTLILDEKMNANAQTYAEQLAKQDSRLIHSDRKGSLGENLYSSTASYPIQNPDADRVTKSWYSEISNYNFQSGTASDKTGHFTQIIWKDTRRLGVGIAFGKEGRKMYVVAQYSPPGNYRNAFQKNVLPPTC